MNPGNFTLSVVSHLQLEHCMQLLEDLRKVQSPLLGKVILTLNLPEHVPSFERFPFEVQVLRNSYPKGFADNHNHAFLYAKSEYFAVLNPDLRIEQDPFPALARLLVDRKIGVATPMIHEADGSVADFARRLVTPGEILKRHLLRRRDRGAMDHPDWVAGMFLAFRHQTYSSLSGFDARYHLYCEDVDLCARLRLRGLQLAIAQDANVTHHAQRASRRAPRPLFLHLSSLCKLWTSRTYKDYRTLLRDGTGQL
jgi:GT2 family glycosyltransferase